MSSVATYDGAIVADVLFLVDSGERTGQSLAPVRVKQVGAAGPMMPGLSLRPGLKRDGDKIEE